jgi:hypothetical protein
MWRRPITTMSEDAAGAREPTTTQQISTTQKIRISARRVS